MNNYCRNCGNKLEKDDLKCSKCDVEVINDRVSPTYAKKMANTYQKEEKKYFSIMVALFIISLLAGVFFTMAVPFLYFFEIVLGVYMINRFKSSQRIKIIFGVEVGLILWHLLGALLLYWLCSSL